MESRLFKNLSQRSAGPLWSLLQQSLRALRDRGSFTPPYRDLLAEELYHPINDLVDALADVKHGKVSIAALDPSRGVPILANISRRVFAGKRFGFFQNVQKRRFGQDNVGLFRVAHGSGAFVESLEYAGTHTFSPDEAFVVDVANGALLPLQPLIFWDACPQHAELEGGHCYFFDKPERQTNHFSFKAVGVPCSRTFSGETGHSALVQALTAMRDKDPDIEILRGAHFQSLS